MSARSMTGFARASRALPDGEVVVSLKSVNHRGLDLHFHMPAACDPFEPAAREAIRRRLQRGHVQIHVAVERGPESQGGGLNTNLLQLWVASYREAAALLGSSLPPDPHAALRIPGMLQQGGAIAWSSGIEAALMESLAQAIDILDAFRAREGEAIRSDIYERSRSVERLTVEMSAIRGSATKAFHQRLQERLGELLRGAAVEPARLAQEAAILAERSDISEEILRLSIHAAQAIELLDAPGEKGKKLDFLLQEMNREANTILSKTGGLGDQGLTLTSLALSAKAEIDKMREQSLNLE